MVEVVLAVKELQVEGCGGLAVDRRFRTLARGSGHDGEGEVLRAGGSTMLEK
jgi:hypothetical protein